MLELEKRLGAKRSYKALDIGMVKFLEDEGTAFAISMVLGTLLDKKGDELNLELLDSPSKIMCA